MNVRIPVLERSRRHVAGRNPEGDFEPPPIARQKHACPHRNRKPFVRIDGDTVGLLDCGEQMPMPRRKKDTACPSRIDMEIGKMLASYGRKSRQIVDRSMSGRSRGRDD